MRDKEGWLCDGVERPEFVNAMLPESMLLPRLERESVCSLVY